MQEKNPKLVSVAGTRKTPAETVVLVPDVCLSEGRFLDGLGLDDLARRVTVVATTGHDLRTTLESVRTKGLVTS